jgi:hypothetical protein
MCQLLFDSCHYWNVLQNFAVLSSVRFCENRYGFWGFVCVWTDGCDKIIGEFLELFFKHSHKMDYTFCSPRL